ncbi:MAG: hypothetical protein GX410_11145 [Elusimicrobia bacterium]|nr:hypothetical protein [Elusimicrobiota bacterium]
MSSNYDWLRELDKKLSRDEMAELLPPGVTWDIYDTCGLEVLIVLLEKMPKIPLYVSPQSLTGAMNYYIKKHSSGDNQRALAMALGISVRKVYDIIKEQGEAARAERQRTPEFDFMREQQRRL